MTFRSPLFAALLLAFATAESSVVELDDEFGESWKAKTWLVMFYAPWCGYCKSFAPVWEDVAKRLHSSRDVDVHVGKLDCTQYKDLASQFEIRGMPTVKLFHKDNEYAYEGRREVDHVVKFVKRAIGPAVVPLKKRIEIDDAVKENTVAFVLVNGNKRIEEIYARVAQKHILTASFYSLQSFDIRAELHLGDGPHLVVFKDGNSYVYRDSRGFDSDALTEWIEQEQLPAFPSIELFEIQDYLVSSKLIVLFALGDKQKEYKFIPKSLEAVKSVAISRKFHPELYFASMERDEVVQRETMAEVSAPCLVVFNFSSNEFYPFENDFSVQAIDQTGLTAFLEKIKVGSIEPHGGRSYYQTIKRFLWAVKDMIKGMWHTQPAMVVILGSLITILFLVLLFVVFCDGTEDQHHSETSSTNDDQDENESKEPSSTGKEKSD